MTFDLKFGLYLDALDTGKVLKFLNFLASIIIIIIIISWEFLGVSTEDMDS